MLVSLRPGTEDTKDTWQFATGDLLQAFADWQKAGMDVQFQMKQRDAIKELADYQVEAQKEVVERMEKLVGAGTERVKDLIVERVNLKQFEIQGRKSIYEADTAVKVAIRTEAALTGNSSRPAWSRLPFAPTPPRGRSSSRTFPSSSWNGFILA